MEEAAKSARRAWLIQTCISLCELPFDKVSNRSSDYPVVLIKSSSKALSQLLPLLVKRKQL